MELQGNPGFLNEYTSNTDVFERPRNFNTIYKIKNEGCKRTSNNGNKLIVLLQIARQIFTLIRLYKQISSHIAGEYLDLARQIFTLVRVREQISSCVAKKQNKNNL